MTNAAGANVEVMSDNTDTGKLVLSTGFSNRGTITLSSVMAGSSNLTVSSGVLVNPVGGNIVVTGDTTASTIVGDGIEVDVQSRDAFLEAPVVSFPYRQTLG